MKTKTWLIVWVIAEIVYLLIRIFILSEKFGDIPFWEVIICTFVCVLIIASGYAGKINGVRD